MTTSTGFWTIAEEDRDRLAVADAEYRETSYGELYDLVNRVSHGLRARGLRRGDCVSTLLPNGVEQLALCLAAFQSGLYVTPINYHLVGPEIAYIVRDSESKALVVHERYADEASRAAEDSDIAEDDRLVVGPSGAPGFRPFAELLEGQPSARPSELFAGSYMFYTSGTTGRPKGVRRPLVDVPADDAARAMGGLFLLFGILPHDGHVHLVQAPLYHTAVNNYATTSLHFGHPVVLMDRYSPEGALERIEKYRVTTSHMVPTMFHRMLKLPEEVRRRYDVSSLRRMIHAAAPCPAETKRKMLEWWGDVIWEYYAATEGGGTIASPEDWRAHPGTVGKPWPISEVLVLDEEGRELPPGQSGTIYMRMNTAPNFEYHKDPQKTARARRRGLFTVGDVGYFDEDGFLFLNDRSSDMIIVGGVNIYPAEIEGVLQQHPAVADVAVFGVPNPDTGEEIKAVIELVSGASPDAAMRDDLMAYCRGRVAKQKWPHSIDFAPELPRDPNGKLYKRKLRDPYWEGHAGKIV